MQMNNGGKVFNRQPNWWPHYSEWTGTQMSIMVFKGLASPALSVSPKRTPRSGVLCCSSKYCLFWGPQWLATGRLRLNEQSLLLSPLHSSSHLQHPHEHSSQHPREHFTCATSSHPHCIITLHLSQQPSQHPPVSFSSETRASASNAS